MRTLVKNFFVLAILVISVLLPGDMPAEEVIVTYPSGRVKDKFSLDSQNRPHGKYETFYDAVDARSRQQPLKGEANFKNGLLHGIYRRLYLNGQPQVMAMYQNGKLDNIYTEFSPTGKIIERSRYEAGMFVDIIQSRPEIKNTPPAKPPARQPTEADIIAEMEGMDSEAMDDQPVDEVEEILEDMSDEDRVLEEMLGPRPPRAAGAENDGGF